MVVNYPKGSEKNPYTIAEYEGFPSGTWPGGYVEGMGYIPGTRDQQTGSGTSQGSASGSDEPLFAGVFPGRATIEIPCLDAMSLEVTISWTQGTVTGDCTSVLSIEDYSAKDQTVDTSTISTKIWSYSVVWKDIRWVGKFGVKIVGTGEAVIDTYKYGSFLKSNTYRFNIDDGYTIPEDYRETGSR